MLPLPRPNGKMTVWAGWAGLCRPNRRKLLFLLGPSLIRLRGGKFPTCPFLAAPPWRQVSQLVRELRRPLISARLVPPAVAAKLPSLGDSDLLPLAAWHAQQVGHPPRLLQLRRSRLPFASSSPRGWLAPWRQVFQRVRELRLPLILAPLGTCRRAGKASVARRFRLATPGGMARTTSRTSSSSPPASPLPAPLCVWFAPWRQVFNLSVS
jgi:hypothetical protein